VGLLTAFGVFYAFFVPVGEFGSEAVNSGVQSNSRIEMNCDSQVFWTKFKILGIATRRLNAKMAFRVIGRPNRSKRSQD